MFNINNNLFDAVENNDINLVGRLIDDGVDVNVFNEKGEVPLHIAARRGHLELVKKLVKEGTEVDIRVRRNEKFTPLQLPIKHKRLEVAKLLIDKGADVNSGDFRTHHVRHCLGGTSLHWAARNCEEVIIRLLTENGADVNATEDDGRTPLCLLVKHHGSLESIRYLMDKGADLNNSRGGTPLYWTHWPEVQRLLIDMGSNVNGFIDPYDEQKSPLHLARNLIIVKLLLEKGADINLVDKYGNTPLHTAYSLPIAKFLLENGADINAANGEGNTPLHDVDNILIAKFLVESGAKINATNHNGYTPLHLAANCRIAECLIETGADYRAVTDEGKSVLHTVAETDLGYRSKFGNAHWLVDFYAQKGMGVNITDDYGNTPLHLCCKQDNVKAAERLLENGADINAVNNNNKKPVDGEGDYGYSCVINMLESVDKLFTAVKLGETLYKIKALVVSCRVINCVQDVTRLTILHYAVQKSQKEVLEFLLSRTRTLSKRADCGSMLDYVLEQIDVNALSLDNWTPLHYATQRNDEDIVKLLLETGAAYDIRTLQGSTPSDLSGNNTIKNLFVLVGNLFEAVKAGQYEQVVRCVAEEKAIVNALDSSGCSPLHCAIHSGFQNIAMFLIEKGANVTLVNNEGCSTLHFAAHKNIKKIADALLKCVNVLGRLKDFINIKSEVGNTALHAATESGSLEIVKCLLRYGAEYNGINKEGKTPANMSTNQDVTDLLKLVAELFENAYKDSLECLHRIQSLEPDVVVAIIRACDDKGNTLAKIVEGNENISAVKLLSKLQLLNEEKFLLRNPDSVFQCIILKEEAEELNFGLFG